MSALTVERVVPASPTRVWTALTSGPALAAWFWPQSWRTIAEVDLEAGGRYRLASTEMDVSLSGEYLEVEPPTRLVQSWQWADDELVTYVTITLASSGEGTRVIVTHDGFESDVDRDNHLQGWNDCLDRLPAHVAPARGSAVE